MLKFTTLLLLTAIMSSCQTSRLAKKTHISSLSPQRNLASSQNILKFLQRLSKRTKIPQHKLEKEILNYIKDPKMRMGHRNHVALGITDDQARKMTSLTDDLPYMDKVRKWAMENITSINRSISKTMAFEVYHAIVGNSRGLKNPYVLSRIQTPRSRSLVRARQQQTSPTSLLLKKHSRIEKILSEIKSSKVQKTYRKNLEVFQLRGKTTPSVLANGQEIVESAALITKKTGLKAMGDNCKDFNKKAAIDILEAKANVDIYRAQLIEDAAHAKAGRSFASVDEIEMTLRLTQDEIDLATRRAFQDVLGHTDDESRLVLSRLKKKPCRLY